MVKPATRKAETAAHLIKRADQSARSKKVTAAMLDDPNAKTDDRAAADALDAP